MIQFPKTSIVKKEDIVLTESQETELSKLINWHLNDGDNLFHILRGSAGTGKTTVLKQFIDRNKYSRNAIAITAPTHKAKKQAETITGLQGLTIQGVLGLRPNLDLDSFDINRPQFDPLAEAMIKSYRLVIVDESSMLGEGLHELICKEARYNNTKVLFVGDPLQLPPVNENISKALTSHDIAELTQVIRQANGNPLLVLLNELRLDIVNGTNNFLSIINSERESFNDKGEGYSVQSKGQFTNTVGAHFNSAEYAKNTDYCKFVAWTNVIVTEWNKFIRGTLFTTKDLITDHDLLMAYNSVINEYQESVIINSEDYLVSGAVHFQDTTNEDSIPVYRVGATSSGYGITAFDIVHEDSIAKFLSIERRLHETAMARRGKYWVDYYKFRAKHLLRQNIMDASGKRLLVKKDIDYGYGITVHKTQGSTYENVFVHLPNLLRNPKSVERKKLVYVALSRASKKAIILEP